MGGSTSAFFLGLGNKGSYTVFALGICLVIIAYCICCIGIMIESSNNEGTTGTTGTTVTTTNVQ